MENQFNFDLRDTAQGNPPYTTSRSSSMETKYSPKDWISNFEKNFHVIFKIIGIQFPDVNKLKHSRPETGSHPSLSRAPPQSTRARTRDNIAPETTGNNKEEKLTRTKFYLMADSPSLSASSFGTGSTSPPKSLPNNFSPVAQWIRHRYYKRIILKSEKLLKTTED